MLLVILSFLFSLKVIDKNQFNHWQKIFLFPFVFFRVCIVLANVTFFTMGDFFSVCASKFRCFETSHSELRNVKSIVDSGLSSSLLHIQIMSSVLTCKCDKLGFATVITNRNVLHDRYPFSFQYYQGLDLPED